MNIQDSIRRILKEESLKGSLIDEIKNEGWFNVSVLVGGDEKLKKITEIHNSYQFMKLFLGLTPKESEDESNTILYKNDRGINVFVSHHYNDKDNVYKFYLNYDLVYKPLGVFRETIGTGVKQEFLQKWLKNNYNINIISKWDIDEYRQGDHFNYLN